MDYDFTIDENDEPVARFSIGHEAIGRWFTEELAIDSLRINELLSMIDQCQQGLIKRHSMMGRLFQLIINEDEVEVVALALNADVDEADLPEDTNVFDQELQAECGLEDFKGALLSWQTFVATTH